MHLHRCHAELLLPVFLACIHNILNLELIPQEVCLLFATHRANGDDALFVAQFDDHSTDLRGGCSHDGRLGAELLEPVDRSLCIVKMALWKQMPLLT